MLNIMHDIRYISIINFKYVYYTHIYRYIDIFSVKEKTTNGG